MESLLAELWATYLQETCEETEYVSGAGKPEPKEIIKSKSPSPEEHLENISDGVDKLHIQEDKDGPAGDGEGWNASLRTEANEAHIDNPETNAHSINADAKNMNVTIKSEASSVTSDKDDHEAASKPREVSHHPHAEAVSGNSTNRFEQEDSEHSNKRVKSQPLRKKSSVEGGRAYIDYLKLEGVEIILLSPSRLNDLSSLSEVRSLTIFM